jgi:hypothetical protein
MAGGRTAGGAEPAWVGTAGTTGRAVLGCGTGQTDVAGVTEDMVKPTGAVAEPTRVAEDTVRPTGAVTEPARVAVGVTEEVTLTGAAVSIGGGTEPAKVMTAGGVAEPAMEVLCGKAGPV